MAQLCCDNSTSNVYVQRPFLPQGFLMVMNAVIFTMTMIKGLQHCTSMRIDAYPVLVMIDLFPPDRIGTYRTSLVCTFYADGWCLCLWTFREH